ncbi:hypothetical protein ElyMa_005656100 [Elysia marginata]|uniref:Uncharacterized protein n=1 Tax=Elysia marginata TaxID=1093978 RepID=A0AAV4FBE2_9GAST|nr:hypothetical protein ElyMa_005656100 [Elysia marginata]
MSRTCQQTTHAHLATRLDSGLRGLQQPPLDLVAVYTLTDSRRIASGYYSIIFLPIDKWKKVNSNLDLGRGKSDCCLACLALKVGMSGASLGQGPLLLASLPRFLQYMYQDKLV